MSKLKTYSPGVNIKLENGGTLLSPSIGYQTWGTLNESKSNIVWVCHALTANSDVFDWWEGLFGPGKTFNAEDHFVVCANVLGSCYGSTGPVGYDPFCGYQNFPELTIRDLVKAHVALADYLGIEQINTLIGGSMGGHQALEWSILEPGRIENLILIATSAIHSPWGVAFNEAQRAAIEADPTWGEQNRDGGLSGMKAARSIALLSYRSYETYDFSQPRESGDRTLKAKSYQRYQGEKLAKRFNAYSYYSLSKTMDSHDVGRDRGGVEAALREVKARTLVISIDSDLLFPLIEQIRIARGIEKATHRTVYSRYGHDGFLIETNQISKHIQRFLPESINEKTELKTAVA